MVVVKVAGANMGGGSKVQTFLHHHVLVWTVVLLLWFQNNQLFCPFVPPSLISTWHCTWISFFFSFGYILLLDRRTFFDCQYHQIRSYLRFRPKALTFFIHLNRPLERAIKQCCIAIFLPVSARVLFFWGLGVGSTLCILFICCMYAAIFWASRSMYFFFQNFSLAFFVSLGISCLCPSPCRHTTC